MFQNIRNFLEQLVSFVAPRKLLFLAIDGVAPRAKMNQQRARRYRKIQEDSGEKKFDSNVITPGTEFMHRLVENLHQFIVQKLAGSWSHLQVIFSDSNVPGEGEHKILDFVRSQRGCAHYDPNRKHIIHGADADLIMLSLITHEPHFYIIRENIQDARSVLCRACGQSGHFAADCQAKSRAVSASNIQEKSCFVKVPVLREYLYYEFQELAGYEWYDFERVVDDFVFLCFFVGNDFLPNLPSLHIRDGAIDGLIYLYCKVFHQFRGFLTEDGQVMVYRLDILFRELANTESDFFNEKRRKNEYFRDKRVADKRKIHEVGQDKSEDAALKLAEDIAKEFTGEDTVRLGEDGYKLRYYYDKFGVTEAELTEFRNKLQIAYIEGLAWVFSYYYNGCQSWHWFYPFHYAPLTSDLHNSCNIRVTFTLGKPFAPYAQLLSVLPPESRQFLPELLADLTINLQSNIIDFYPKNFKVDVNGKRFEWQGVMLLPFIDEKRLVKEFAPIARTFSPYEKQRNSSSYSILYCLQYDSDLQIDFVNMPFLFEFYSLPRESPVKNFTIQNMCVNPHSSQVTRGVVLPQSEVDEEVFRMGDRTGYGGYSLINLISKHLTLDPKSWTTSRQSAHAHFNTRYNNNRSVSHPEGEKRRKLSQTQDLRGCLNYYNTKK